MKAENRLPRFRMAVDERMDETLPPVRDHEEPIPPTSFLSRKILDDFGQRRKDGGALSRALDDVVEGVGERLLLKAAVNVPTGPTDMCTALKSNQLKYLSSSI